MQSAAPSGPPGPDEAKVIFFRTINSGTPETFPIFVDRTLVGYSERGSYIEVLCEPGGHRFYSPSSSTLPGLDTNPDSLVTADLDAGKTYYVEAYASGGCGGVRTQLRPLHPEDSGWRRIGKKIDRLERRVISPEQAARDAEAYDLGAMDEQYKNVPARGSHLRRDAGK